MYTIKMAYLDRLYGLKKIQEHPSAQELQYIADIVHETIRQMRGLGEPVEHWDFIFVHAISKLLDESTLESWELKRQSDSPTAEEMLKFLDDRAEALRNVKRSRDSSASTDAKSHASDQGLASKKSFSFGRKSRMEASGFDGGLNKENSRLRNKYEPCEFCDQGTKNAS